MKELARYGYKIRRSDINTSLDIVILGRPVWAEEENYNYIRARDNGFNIYEIDPETMLTKEGYQVYK